MAREVFELAIAGKWGELLGMVHLNHSLAIASGRGGPEGGGGSFPLRDLWSIIHEAACVGATGVLQELLALSGTADVLDYVSFC